MTTTSKSGRGTPAGHYPAKLTNIHELAQNLYAHTCKHTALDGQIANTKCRSERAALEAAMKRGYGRIQILEDAIISTPAENLTDAAIQLALIYADIASLARPGANTNTAELAPKIEAAAWSVLSAVVKAGRIKAADTAIDWYVALDVNPFPVVEGVAS